MTTTDPDKLDTSKAIPRFIWLAVVMLNTGLLMLGMLLLGTQMNLPGLGVRLDTDVTVIHVFNHSPAQAAGLQSGDRFIAINGEEISDPSNFTFPSGTAYDVTYERGGDEREVHITRQSGWFDFFSVGALNSGLPLGLAQAIAPALDIVFFVIFLGVSASLFWSRAGNRMILLLACALMFLAVNFSLGSQAMYDAAPPVPLIGTIHFIITVLMVMITLLLMPDFRFDPSWSWVLLVVTVVVVAVGNLGLIPYTIVVIAQLVLYIVSIALLMRRTASISDPQQKAMMRLFTIGAGFMLAAYAFYAILDYLVLPALPDPWAFYPYLYSYGKILRMVLALGLPIALWMILRRKLI